MIILMDAIEELSQLSHSMRQAAGLLADEDIDETSSSASSKCSSTFLNIVALGNTGAGKSAVLNSLIGHPALVSVISSKPYDLFVSCLLNDFLLEKPFSKVSPSILQPTGEDDATRAPVCIDLTMDSSLSSKSIILQTDSKSQQASASALRHSLQDRLSKISSKCQDEI